MYMIGNAHIDPVWLWRWQEGYHEVRATFRSALDRLNEYDDFVFTCACACYYKWIEEHAPSMFEEIKSRVAEGRWQIVGGMWIQPDCNMPSAESFARQFLYSKRYFKEKFGVDVKTAYNVDSFGHSWSLPEIMKAAGIENYVMMRPGIHENPEIPGYLFDWYSADGSSVRTYRIPGDRYNSPFDTAKDRMDEISELEERWGIPLMCFYGVGNHGGGPTIRNINSIKEYMIEHPEMDIRFSSPDAYFDDMKSARIPKWKSEMQHHASGCYSATSIIKAMNRRSENKLTSAETVGIMSRALTGYKPARMMQAWENLMFNQFHDVMCGCSIREAYDDARDQHGEIASIADRELNAAAQDITWAVDTMQGVPARKRERELRRMWGVEGLGTPVIAINPSAFRRNVTIQVMGEITAACDESGNYVPVQVVRASRTNGADKWDTAFVADVPAFGYRLYWMYTEEEEKKAFKTTLCVTGTSIENKNIRAQFDAATGAIISLFDKRSGREMLSAPAMMKLFDNENADTWAHMVFKFPEMMGQFGNPAFEILEEGPVRAKLRVTTSLRENTLIQEFALYENSDQIEVNVRLCMNEKFRMAKMCFPVAAENPMAHAEISVGAITRKCDGCEETMHRWADISDENGGIAILNDGRYSFSADKNELRVTFANTCIFADHYGQNFRDTSCRHADMGEMELNYAIVPHSGKWEDANLPHRGEAFNRVAPFVIETYHEGPLAPAWQGIDDMPENIIVTAIKRAEDGTGYVVRFTENEGRNTDIRVNISVAGREMRLEIAPWQIKTYYIPDDTTADIREILITE